MSNGCQVFKYSTIRVYTSIIRFYNLLFSIIKLQLDLGARGLKISSKTNRESGPRFAEVCQKVFNNWNKIAKRFECEIGTQIQVIPDKLKTGNQAFLEIRHLVIK